MPRTFSLARLMLGITAFCILCGLAVNFPFVMRLFVVFVLPTALIWLTIDFVYRDNIFAIFAAFPAAFCTPLLLAVGPLVPLIAAIVVCCPVVIFKRIMAR